MTRDIFIHVDQDPPAAVRGGSLEGLTVSIQPNMSVRGWPTEAGSVALERYVALEDATVIGRLRNAGAVITGSTRMSELGFGVAGDTAHRAVSDGAVNVALVTDTMGEARLSAAAAALYGFKPSYGIVSRYGLIGLVPSMESFGIIAKTPTDIGAVLQAIAGHDDRDFSMSPATLDFNDPASRPATSATIGIVREALEMLDPDEARAFTAVVTRLEETGMTVRELSVEDYGLFPAVHTVVGSVEASSSAGKYDSVRYGHRAPASKNWNDMYLQSRAESFGLMVKTYLFQGAYFQFENYEAFENACRIRSRLVQQADALYKVADFILCPTLRNGMPPSDVCTVNDLYEFCASALPANVTGHPAMHIPGVLFGRETDPGFTLCAPHLGDVRLVSFASYLMNVAEGAK